ncbi:DNA polymerase III subunit alpha [Saccharomonospora saliphila]|uniref:DNA polymerase III subunit alpha n=1 Tax=Saccharomonospora saliphila TaxID=369829 RepID=UPI00037696BA|nr:DNA polymerase III subunit alpha [Saccharomonospora saliphila]
MSTDSFVHLHVHTEYSMLDGAAKIKPLFSEASRLGMPAVGMTDHGNMYGADEFYQQATKAGIKPIIGIEAYVAPESRFHKKPVFWGQTNQRGADEYGEGGDVSGAGAYTHMTMLAENSTGLRNLFTLSSLASMEGYYRKPRCLLPGQEIMTRDGMKRIEEVRVGDEVLTHRGRFRPVVEVMRNQHEGDIFGVELSGRYSRITWMTGEHPVLIRDRDGDKSWVDARDIAAGRPGTGTREAVDNWNSWVCMPRVRPDAPVRTAIHTPDYVNWEPVPGEPDRFVRESARRDMGPTRHYGTMRHDIDLDYDFGFFLGLYVAEGCVDREHTVSWYFHEDERDLVDTCHKLIEKYTGKSAVVRGRADRDGYRGVSVSVSSSLLAQLLSALCGSGGARYKHLPGFVFDAGEEFMRGAFEGVLEGDGSKSRTNVLSIEQTSEALHWQLRTLAARLRADFAGTYCQPVRGDVHAQSYRANFSPEGGSVYRRTLADHEYVYKPIRDVHRKHYSGPVYNIEVADDHSYVTDFAVHNCDRELIAEHAEGIIATTGCPSGEVQTRLRLGQKKEALAAAADYRDIFGAENFFLELMDHGLPIERSVREGLLEIGRELGLRPLATNDSHYVTKDQADSHSALLCVQSGKTLSDPNRFKFDGDGYYLKSAAEMREYWDTEVPGAADSTLLIAERVESYADVYSHRDRMPKFDVPEGHDESSWLHHEVMAGLDWRFPEGVPDGYRDRAEFELGVIAQKGFPSYFLVVADLINYARGVDIRVGPGRGSAAGSLVAYALGITNLDPIPQKLLFERFLNPERESMPDIDIDFDDRRRGEMVRYATDKYGADRVAQVITFGTIKTKAAIKDAARVHHGQPGYALADRITKALPPPIMAKDIPLAGIVDPEHDRYAEAAEVRSLIETDSEVKTIFETARGLEGLIRNAGVHACAVIMSSEPLMDAIPLWQRDDGAVITGWDYPSCEAIGLLKMDFLGLRNLTVIGDAIANIRANRGEEIDLDRLGLDNPEAYKLLGRGDTLGVFQLDGGAMRDLLRRMQPTGFDDIVAVLALYRPGPMGVNAHNDYADRKNGRQTVKPIHPELAEPLEEILAETYGLIVYQEQIMQIAQKVAGYSMGRADVLRRAMGKKKAEVLEKEFEGFQAGMKASELVPGGFSDEAIQALWDTILPFAGYAFNKSHAAGYGLIAYWTAYLKANYPAEYMAALLTSVGDNKDKSAVYLAECRKLGIKVLPPDVNESTPRFAAVGDDIRFGLGAVRNVGANVVDSIIASREKKGKYASFTDFLDKSELVACNKRVVESLIKAGAFDSLGNTRLSMVRVHEEAVEAVVPLKRQEAMGQFDLFGGGGSDAEPDASSSPLAHLSFDDDEWPRKQLLGYEREMLGLYVSAHPLDGAERILRKHAKRPIAAILADPPKEGEIEIAGLITALERRVNKKGEPWAIATVEDMDASLEVLFFPKSYALFSADLVEDNAVVVKGRVNWREDKMSVFAAGLVPLDLSDITTGDEEPPLMLLASAEKITHGVVSELKSTLQAHRGETPVRLKLVGGSAETVFALYDYPVTVSSGLMGELKGIPGIAAST